MVTGDALGNAGFYMPIGFAILIALTAVTAFLAARAQLGIGIAFAAIAAAATIPVHDLITPVRGSATLYRFGDNSGATLEGLIAREPERVEGGRNYLYVRVERAGADAAALAPTTGAVRVTIRGEEHFSIGDEVRVTSRIRFPRNDGDQGEFDNRG